jgi:hypothetical protein
MKVNAEFGKTWLKRLLPVSRYFPKESVENYESLDDVVLLGCGAV